MKKTIFILFAIFSVTTLMAKKPPFQLLFGSAGGFSGQTITYNLNSDGSFSKEDNIAHKKENLAKVKCKDIKALRKLIAAVNFSTLNLSKPGNMSSFITLVQDGKEYKTIWSGSLAENPALDALNKKLNSLITHK